MRYWLFKTEPGTYSWDDLVAEPGRTACWDGVRNYQARNLLRDDVRRGDRVLVYHSSVRPQVVAGVAEVVREGYPDPAQFDPESPYFDPRATPENPRWVAVDIRALRPLEPPVTRDELRSVPALAAMMVLRRGARLSIQPVTREEWAAVLALRGLDADTLEPR